METCGILWTRGEFKDEHGCTKPDGHNDSHTFKTDDGRTVEWWYDYEVGWWDEDGEEANEAICYSVLT